MKTKTKCDIGDMQSYSSLARTYDTLRKSGKFTAQQNKVAAQNAFDSVGEIVEFCEREGGFIPSFPLDIPQDKIDVSLQDQKNYVKKLVTQDLGFGQQIEDALRKLQAQKEIEEAEDEHGFTLEEDQVVTEKDYESFFMEVQAQREQDLKIMQGEEEEEPDGTK